MGVPVRLRAVRMVLLLALALPTSDPLRKQAVDASATALALVFRAEVECRRPRGAPSRVGRESRAS